MNPVELGLPHRDPFLFVNTVESLEPGASVRAAVRFSGGEAFFAGHFPGNPIVPGVILTEALAQAAGIAGAAGEPGATYLLSAIRMMKFPRAAHPRESIELFAEKTGSLGLLLNFDVRATVGDVTVAEGQIVLARTNG